jgi:23S rRNA (pseudouridine1915-N3)-methyltransferase
MKITLLCTGKCKDKAILGLEAEYVKRLKAHFPTTVIELPQSKAVRADEIKQKEAEAQLAKVPAGSVIIALDERGELMPTVKFAKKLEGWKDSGTPHVTIIIGGAEGLHDSIRQKAKLLLSLSPMTFPHMMVRPIILEQIYRAGTVIAGHPYHREG